MPPLKIAIIGAGPGGTLLARLLTHPSPTNPTPKNIAVTIFEAESALDIRSQGGTLDLRPGGGLKAMRAAGLWDEFCRHARWSGEALKVVDKNLTIWLSRSAGKQGEPREFGAAPEIDRKVLRGMLLASVPERVIRWGRKVVQVEEVDRAMVVRFENGEEEGGFDLVVGADGAWSRVRKALSDVVPFYSGIGGSAFTISDAEKKAPEVWKLINGGSVFSYSDAKGLTGQVLGDGTVHVGTWSVRNENWMQECGYDVHDLKQAREGAKNDYDGWSSRLTNFLDAVDCGVAPRNLYMLPVDFVWKHRRGVTLLGDAAHLMTPFAGIGVNNALEDAMELSFAIIDAANEKEFLAAKEVLDARVIKYEEELFPRMRDAANITKGSMEDMYFTEGAPRTSIHRWCARIAGHDMPRVVRPLLKAGLYTYFFFFRMFV